MEKQELVDSAMGHVLGAIRDAKRLEKKFCEEDNHEGMLKTSEVIRALRVVKELGIKAHGTGGIQILGGFT